MDRPYDDIPREGEHRKGTIEEEPSTNVRAQEPVLPFEKTDRTETLYQLSFSEAARSYRICAWREGAEPTEGFEEIGQFPAEGGFQRMMERLPDKPRFVVFENVETGEVFYDQEGDLGGDWTGGGRFDQVTIFDDPGEAEAYVAGRQESGVTNQE